MGTRVRLARVQRGWTQEQLAGMIGVTKATVSNIETGRYSVSVELLVRLAALLGKTVAWLVGEV